RYIYIPSTLPAPPAARLRLLPLSISHSPPPPPSPFFFLLLIPRPPRSTLFPYTTLFRPRKAPRPTGRPHAPPPRSGRGSSSALRDRKSTRLNSSHRTISYAVFCLKKKKIKKKEQQRRHMC